MLKPMTSVARRTRTISSACLLLPLLLSGCESGARQDPLEHPGSVMATRMPAASSGHMYHESTKSLTSTPVAYEEPPTLSYADRPLLENISASLELADYLHALRQADLARLLGRNGPFTVFAIPNEPLERYAATIPGGGLMAPSNAALLHRVLAYTIVRGNWSPQAIDKAMAKSKTTRIALRTMSGDVLTVSRGQNPGAFVLLNGSGRETRIWLNGAPQSNGVLYFTQDILPPNG
ncbi:hypothetical protein SSA02_24810 [Swaminathania salitolerans]|uniref:FAS1 domain-containing protein n=1 Tax=Swaminathania salitolerans TaxID=182838 RepID=A0A511BZ93_9PROT|nr:hypothetical protein SSA02_24810 [Swaminathania salitolerans]